MRFQSLSALTLTLLITSGLCISTTLTPAQVSAAQNINDARNSAPSGFNNDYESFLTHWTATQTYGPASELATVDPTAALFTNAEEDLNLRELDYLSTQTYITGAAKETLINNIKVLGNITSSAKRVEGSRWCVSAAVMAVFVAGVVAL